MNSLDDHTLIQLVLEGNTSAFDVIVRRYNTKVYSLAYRLLNSVEDAEDVAQDTFSQAFKGLGSFRGTSKFYTWLFRITYNLAISQRRKRKPALSLNSQTDSQGEITLPSDDASPMKNMEDEEGKTYIGRLKAVLSHEAGSLGTLAKTIAKDHGNINNFKITSRSPDFFEVLVDVEVKDIRHLSTLMASLRSKSCIYSVERYN